MSKQIDVWKNRARGYSALTRVWPLLTLLPFSHWKWGVREDWRGQSTNTGPAPNPHHPLPIGGTPKLSGDEGTQQNGGPAHSTGQTQFSCGCLQTTTSLANKELICKGTFLCTGDRDPYGPLSLSVLRLAPLHPSFWSRCCCQSKSSNMQIQSRHLAIWNCSGFPLISVSCNQES